MIIGDISKYQDFFHDGDLKEIEHKGNKVIFTMTSAEMGEEDLVTDIKLSNQDPFTCLRGKLHIEGIRRIFINKKPFTGILEKEYDSAEIFDLLIQKNEVKLSIEWTNYPPKAEKEDFSVIQIEAEKIYWENIPTLPWE